jgi:hypothetical protein
MRPETAACAGEAIVSLEISQRYLSLKRNHDVNRRSPLTMMDISEKPLNIMKMRLKKSTPMYRLPSFTLFGEMVVRKKSVLVITDT